MNVKRFTGRTSRDALNLVRQALGDDAVVLSTRPCPDGVEVLAMAPDAMQQIEQAAAQAPTVRASAASAEPRAPRVPNSVAGNAGAALDQRNARQVDHQIPVLRQEQAPQKKAPLAQRAAR
jgi:flagellar biosynthesis protein FlhF